MTAAIDSHIADGEGRCRENDGEPCEQCAQALQAEHDYWRRQYDAALPSERDPKAYAESMRDAGRGHLVRHLP